MDDFFKGRGAQFNSKNPFLSQDYVEAHVEGIDEPLQIKPSTRFLSEFPRKIVNPVNSPDLGYSFSANPYQGCEHGCIYCYARNAHQYWGLSAGLDFESRIIVKHNAPELLEKHFLKKTWKPSVIMLSGNTDCYQPIERKLKITRKMLKVFLKYGNPVSLISKNSLILRDLDILGELARENLVRVMVSLTTLDEKLREKMEPRTASAKKRLQVIEILNQKGIPAGVMTAPVVPGLNNHEIPQLISAAADAGAMKAGYTVVRLNGAVKELFHDWLFKVFPERADKVWNQICQLHGGQVNDTQWGRRIKGEGPLALAIAQIFKASLKKYMPGRDFPRLNYQAFRRNGNFNLF
ncbi:MAG: PA0069 family radical SAM protein [Candidatus Cyclobacteriaceae bacterium M3_2C_046]